LWIFWTSNSLKSSSGWTNDFWTYQWKMNLVKKFNHLVIILINVFEGRLFYSFWEPALRFAWLYWSLISIFLSTSTWLLKRLISNHGNFKMLRLLQILWVISDSFWTPGFHASLNFKSLAGPVSPVSKIDHATMHLTIKFGPV
jgi:hypothetical protein